MFGYCANAPAQILAARRAERASAHARWPFLTSLDLSSIRNAEQLTGLVKDRMGVPALQAQADVGEWLAGYNRRVAPASPPLIGAIMRRMSARDAEAAEAKRGNDLGALMQMVGGQD